MDAADRLDAPADYGAVDLADAGTLIRDLPEQLAEGRRIGEAAHAVDLRTPRAVAALGMGGSGIVGKVLEAAVAPVSRWPFLVVRDFVPPAAVGPGTLAFLISYSGNTLETLTAAEYVKARGAAAVVVTSGGRLAERATTSGWPWLKIPPGRPPRCSLGFMSGAVMAYLEKAGVYEFPTAPLLPDYLRGLWSRWGWDIPTARNDAKKLAVAINEAGAAAIYGAGLAGAVAAERFRGQLAENAKFLATGHYFPELCHNELVAFEVPTAIVGKLHVVILRPAREERAAKAQLEAARDLIQPAVAGITEVVADGGDVLRDLFGLIYFGDLVSYYLALLRGVDPTPVRNVVALKERLAHLTVS